VYNTSEPKPSTTRFKTNTCRYSNYAEIVAEKPMLFDPDELKFALNKPI